ncbi:BlaI/MecI/CopY family transcriptional regulator [Chengkuizengella axinellae]|uniref:BlaI/MecI/CopY family transcriptional regulator n=1 Tax=Chengkuizengella axinellae TaxID=3064388 RepID=A0ABT9IWQ2_9BACL|nr:BlaI/MecI/CopY family transcriptional regulator [Chengkuizengella sp. 2205SS18-9]MDP5273527.1 BlaI/MecI/CopY family transcriptional regulator [Chengkuizengella sp. 2205SS18-9]
MKISDAEWRVMEELWKNSPLTSSEIIDRLKDSSEWSPKTIHTLINRLVKKEVLGVNKEGRFKQFHPLISADECRRQETTSFLKKIYDGSRQMFLLNFIKNEKLTEKEIEELKEILEQKKARD